MGGTADIVSFAKEVGMPVVWFHSVTGELQIFNEKPEYELLHDAELDFLNDLPDVKSEFDANTEQGLAWSWFRKVDHCANISAPQLRRLAAIPIVCTAAAALVTGAASGVHNITTWLSIGSALGILSAALPFALGLSGRQSLWARTRTAAEVCRSVLALWDTPASYQAIGPEVIPEFAGMLGSLNYLKMRDRAQAGVVLEDFKQRYRHERVSGQIAYFSKHAAQSAAEARRYHAAIKVSVGLAVVMAAWLFVGSYAFKGLNPGHWKHLLALGASIAFQVATVAGALIVVNDCERRRQRYREMHYLLTEWDAQLDRLRTWTSVLRVANRIERSLLIEVIEWRSVMRNRKMPSK